MNQETEQNINEAINWLQKTGESVQDFAVEQAPLYCREVVAWEFWSGLIESSAGLLLVVVGITFLILLVRWVRADHGEPNFRTMGSMFVAFICLPFGILSMAGGIPKTIKSTVAPRMVIVEHLNALIGK